MPGKTGSYSVDGGYNPVCVDDGGDGDGERAVREKLKFLQEDCGSNGGGSGKLDCPVGVDKGAVGNGGDGGGDVGEIDSGADGGDDARLTWEKKAEYILSNIGYCVGLGNVWRFPYVCIRNGGGAFLIPFFLCLTLCAMPLFFLEASIGQYTGRGPYGAWAAICPLFNGIGIAMNILCLMVIWYYSMILAWTLIYLVNCCKATLPWTLCGQDWNTANCISLTSSSSSDNASIGVTSNAVATTATTTQSSMNTTTVMAAYNSTNGSAAFGFLFNETSVGNGSVGMGTTSSSEEFWLYNVLDISSGLDDIGGVPWHTATALFVSNLCILLGVIRGIKSSGKVVYVSATLPYLLLTLLIIRGCLLPGAMDGLIFYVKPDIGKLLDMQTWLEAAIQVFYSLGPTYGCIITMASYNRFNNNCIKDSILLAFACEGTSVFAGFAIFSVLGHMAYIADVPVGNFTSSGAGLAFVVYPQAISLLPLPQLWGVLFFLMLFSLGLDTQFCNVETIVTSALDVWPRTVSKYRTPLTAALMLVASLVSLPFAARGGMYIFQLVDWYIAAFSILLIGALECLVVSWIYGADRLFRDIEEMTGRRPPRFFSLAWKIFTPGLLLCVLVGTLSTYEAPKYGDYVYTQWGVFLGWNFAFVSFLPIPVCALWQVYKGRGTVRERIQSACHPSEGWTPSMKGCKGLKYTGTDSNDSSNSNTNDGYNHRYHNDNGDHHNHYHESTNSTPV